MENEVSCELFNESCEATLEATPDEFIDLTVTSPPYNVDLGKNIINKDPYDLYNDNKQHHEYIAWMKNVFSLVYQKTKRGGRLIINVGDGQNGRVPTHSDIIQTMANIGWIPMATIIWNKNTCSPRTAWGSFASPSSPAFPTPFEYIICFAKQDRKIQHKGETDLTKEEFIKFSLALWSMAPAKKSKTGHPAAFPEELPYRCIKMFSYIGDVIYDPFSGSGTTLRVAKRLGRHSFGSEISSNYCNLFNNQ